MYRCMYIQHVTLGRTGQKGPVLEKNALNPLVHNLLEIDFQRVQPNGFSSEKPTTKLQFPGQTNSNPVPQPLCGLTFLLVHHCADTTLFRVITFMMMHVYLPHSDRQVDWIGRSQPFKNCWGFGISTFLDKSFKSWVTGFPPAPSFFCSHAFKIFQDEKVIRSETWLE